MLTVLGSNRSSVGKMPRSANDRVESHPKISSVQLHGEVGVPVLETSCDKAVATIDLLQDILIPIRVRPTSVIMEQDIPTMELGAIIDERRAQVSHRVHAVQEELGYMMSLSL